MTPSQPIDAQACQISKTTMCSDPHKNVDFSKDRRVVLEPNLDWKGSSPDDFHIQSWELCECFIRRHQLRPNGDGEGC